MHQNALSWWVKTDKEVKGLQSLTTSLEKERNELLEKTKQLEAEQKVLEKALDLEENISKCHLDALEVARKWSKAKQRKRWQLRKSFEKNRDAKKCCGMAELFNQQATSRTANFAKETKQI